MPDFDEEEDMRTERAVGCLMLSVLVPVAVVLAGALLHALWMVDRVLVGVAR